MKLNSHYTVDVLDETFIVNSILTAQKTALVRYFDNDGDEFFSMKYGVIEPQYIYDKIKAEESIDVSRCYVHNFSISEYRKLNNIEDRTLVNIKNINASEAFFDSSSVVDFSFVNFEDDAIFEKVHFGKGKVYFFRSKFNGKVNFADAFFGKGDADFQFADFGNQDVTFENAGFHYGDITFVNCTFGDGNLNFHGVTFEDGKVDFHFSKFGKGVKNFDQCHFGGGDVDFKRCEFGPGKTDFRRVHFGDGNVNFEETIFTSGKVSFKLSDFGNGDVNFHMVDFGEDHAIFDKTRFGNGIINFHQSISTELSFRDCELNTYVDLRVNNCDLLDLTDCINRDIIEIQDAEGHANVKVFLFTGMRNLGQLYLHWEESDIYNQILNQGDKSSNRQKSEQFRILKENFHNLGQYDDEDYAYVEFKRFELKAKTEEAIAKNPANRTWVYPKAAFEFFIFDKIGLYATNPLRVLFSTFIIYVGFSLTYYIIPHLFETVRIVPAVDHPGGDSAELSHFESAFYHSAITFLTIGYGDYFPIGFFRILSAIEGWCGVFLMSYFTVAFVRKILR